MTEPLWRTVWRFFKKLELELPYDPEILLLGIYPEKTINERDTFTLVFVAALFTIAKTRKQLDVHPHMNGYRNCVTYIQWKAAQL